MDSKQIYNVLKRDKVTHDYFRGVFPLDLLGRKSVISKKYDNYYVCNTQPQTESGQHWVAVHVDKSQVVGEFFDSYGQKPLQEFNNFLKINTEKWYRTDKVLQSPFTSVCGQYCIFYVYHKCLGMSLTDILYLLNVDNPDIVVNEFVNTRYRGLDLHVYDEIYMNNQIATMFNQL